MMNRRTKTLLPTATTLLQPSVIEEHKIQRQLEAKEKQRVYFANKKAKDLPSSGKTRQWEYSQEWQQGRYIWQIISGKYN